MNRLLRNMLNDAHTAIMLEIASDEARTPKPANYEAQAYGKSLPRGTSRSLPELRWQNNSER